MNAREFYIVTELSYQCTSDLARRPLIGEASDDAAIAHAILLELCLFVGTGAE